MQRVTTTTTRTTYDYSAVANDAGADRKPSRLANFGQPFAMARSKANKMIRAVRDAVRDAKGVYEDLGRGFAKTVTSSGSGVAQASRQAVQRTADAADVVVEAGRATFGKAADAVRSTAAKMRKPLVSLGSSFAEASTAIRAEAQRVASRLEAEAEAEVDGSPEARADSTPARCGERAPSGLYRPEGYQASESFEACYATPFESFCVWFEVARPAAYGPMLDELDLHYHLECVKCEAEHRPMSPMWSLFSTNADLVWSHFFDPIVSARLQDEITGFKQSLFQLSQLG